MALRLMCPFCRTALPAVEGNLASVLTCASCAAEVDVSRAGTGVGRPRFLPEIDRTGEVVGSFRLAERIGAGGMGTVYRGVAAGERLFPPVAAVKFLTPALAGERGVAARFEREMRVLRGLDHPGIVALFDHGAVDGVPWFAMELVDGPDLRSRLGAGPLTPAEIAQIFPRLLDALAHAHARGVVHRDLKPANVLLGGGAAKLADFGIALAVGNGAFPGIDPATAATPLTETAAVIGTLPYMSPEQRTGSRVGAASDLYSVGVMLYESATGRLPWGAFPPPSRVNRAFTPVFDRVVARLLQPEPEERFASASNTAAALRAALRPGRGTVRAVAAGGAVALVAALAFGLPALSEKLGANLNVALPAGKGAARGGASMAPSGKEAGRGVGQQADVAAPFLIGDPFGKVMGGGDPAPVRVKGIKVRSAVPGPGAASNSKAKPRSKPAKVGSSNGLSKKQSLWEAEGGGPSLVPDLDGRAAAPQQLRQ